MCGFLFAAHGMCLAGGGAALHTKQSCCICRRQRDAFCWSILQFLLGYPANVLSDDAPASLADPGHSLGSFLPPPAVQTCRNLIVRPRLRCPKKSSGSRFSSFFSTAAH